MRTFPSLVKASSLAALISCGATDEVSAPQVYSKNPGVTNLSDLSPVDSTVAVLKNGDANCSGVAIAKSYVLTAAHCVSTCGNQISGNGGAIACQVLGQTNQYLVKDRFDNEYEVDSIILPERYRLVNNVSVEGQDIALIKLKWHYKNRTAALADEGTAGRVLADNQDRVESPSQTLITAGYGVFDEMTRPVWFDGKLRAAYVPFRVFAGIQGDDEIVAGSTRVHAAKGDSGGPLFVNDGSGKLKVAGIASRLFTPDSQTTSDTDGLYYTYTARNKIRNWVINKMQQNGGDTGQIP